MHALTLRSLVAFATVATGIPILGAPQQQRRLHPLPELDQNVKTGPAVGSKIPAFEAIDQHGRLQTFETLRGPKGLVLLFFRSADW